MARYQLILTYDGTGFSGSQRQAGRRTVQGELETALRTLGWPGRAVLMAGRTDTGVHASGQVAALDFAWAHGSAELQRALNAKLPRDLAVRQVAVVEAGFHPRFDAIARRYEYTVLCRPTREPLRERFAWRVWPQLDGTQLTAAGRLFLGTHDFSAFGSPSRPDKTTRRTVTRSEWNETERGWTYLVECEAFLYRMVRRMVFVGVSVARGQCPAEAVTLALDSPRSPATPADGRVPPGLAPANGLNLVDVAYGSIDADLKRRYESVQDVLSESR